MDGWMMQVVWILVTIVLVALNGFFVAAEFALVKLRASRLVEMSRQGLPFVGAAQWMSQRLDRALSACQLGITMASLGLGWVGEPALARLMTPVFLAVGITSTTLQHTLAFIIAFSIITAAHIVIGEQAPKIYAIRRPGRTARWCAVPLKWFYLLTYPLLAALNGATAFVLRFVGIQSASEHDAAYSEAELRMLLGQAHAHGELTPNEHRLLDAVFEFDDTLCRQVMVPRGEVAFFDVNRPYAEAVERFRRSKHTRYPLCDGSMDKVLGVVHIKDLVNLSAGEEPDLAALSRPPRYVPETMLLGKLLNTMRAHRQHLVFVVDEYGTVIGVVTLENVLETLVGAVQDEFDDETPRIVPEGGGRYLVDATLPIEAVKRSLKLHWDAAEVETLAGLVTKRLERLAEAGDRVTLEDAEIEVLEVRHNHVTRVRVTVRPSDAASLDV